MSSASDRKLLLRAESDRQRDALGREWNEFRADVDETFARVRRRADWLGTALELLAPRDGANSGSRFDRQTPGGELGTLVRLGLSVARLFRRR
ncbi:MAG: hypothetical protein HZA52_16170 [Planctomycetes bacterium]|nr:hypothetical protein [Planctomycetota bacterium]